MNLSYSVKQWHVWKHSVNLGPVPQMVKFKCEKGAGVSVLPCFLPSFLSPWFSTYLLFLFLGLLLSLLPALTCTSVNQTVVFLPGGMCVDKTKALPFTGQISGKVKVGRSEESTPPGSVKRHNTLMHATHTLDPFFHCTTGVSPLNTTFFYCSVSSYATPLTLKPLWDIYLKQNGFIFALRAVNRLLQLLWVHTVLVIIAV